MKNDLETRQLVEAVGQVRDEIRYYTDSLREARVELSKLHNRAHDKGIRIRDLQQAVDDRPPRREILPRSIR